VPLGDAARATLETAGFAIESTLDGAWLRRSQLDAASLDVLAAALGPAAAGQVRIEQTSMNEVFSHVIAENVSR
jgi:hypothetical protein